ASLDPNSIQVKGNNAYTIMSTKHQVVYGDEMTSPRVKQLQDSLEELQFKVAEINVQRDLIQQEKNLLLANYSIKGANSVITAEDITEVADMVKERLKASGYKLIELNAKDAQLQRTIQALNQRLSSIQANSANNPSVIDLVLLAKNEGKSDIRFSYFVPNAGWTPTYDLRAEDISSPIDFSYKAQVYQSTGLDWEDVKLTISTGNPSVAGNLPTLNPWWLYMYDPAQTRFKAEDRKAKYRMAEAAPAAVAREDDGFSQSFYNGGLTSASYTQTNSNTVNTEFSISIPYDIPSDNQAVEVVMQHESFKAEYRYMCVPKLDQSAYLMASMTNWAQYGLMPGESNIYFKGTYVGQGFIDPALANDTLQVNMGRDNSVVVRKEMVKDFCKNGNWAGKKWVTKAYKITVKNQKTVPIKIEIIDQLPKTNNNDVEVVTEEISGAKCDAEKGELRWVLDLNAGQSDERIMRFTVKYPRKFVIDL
ncbi:MAG: DUF4139 domain-containing protein, partial [Bacteroidetes bacterium]|nr:DUF4139 domain-containing protein [Bacteroidota bacterium]